MTKRRDKYIPLSGGKFVKYINGETEQNALDRVNANNNLALTPPLDGVLAYNGAINTCTQDLVSGWALDRYSDVVSPYIDLYLNDVKVVTVQATQARPDIATLYGINGYNLFGWQWSVPASYKTIGNVTVKARLKDSIQDFSNSPTSFTGTGGGTTTLNPNNLTLRYSYSASNSGTLSIQAIGSGSYELMIERVDGVAISSSNSQNPSLSGGVYYGFGSINSDGYTMDWTFYNIPSVALRITLRKSGLTTPVVFTPTLSTNTPLPLSGSTTNPPTTSGGSTTSGSSTTATPTTSVYTYNQRFEAENVVDGTGTISTGDPASSNGGLRGPYVGPSDYLNYIVNVAASGVYQWQLRYQTNLDQNAHATMIVNGGSPNDFVIYGASGNKTTSSGSLTLQSGSNTVRVQGRDNNGYGTFFQDYLQVSGSVVVSGSTSNIRQYSKVLFVGNSITDHSPSTDWTAYHSGSVYGTWGMDASAANKDYKHILTSYLQTLNSAVETRSLLDFSGNFETDGPYFESDYWQMTGGFDRFTTPGNWGADLIIMRLSENVSNLDHDFPSYYKQLIDKLRTANPSAQIILTTSVWNTLNSTQVNVSNLITAVGAERGYPVANLNNIPNATSGFANHPPDSAMQIIADRIWAVIPKTLSPPPTTAVVPVGFTAYSDQGWTGADEKVIQNSLIEVRFKKSVGAAITYAALKSNNQNLNNDKYVQHNGQTISDKGRQWQWADYCTPRSGQNYTAGGQTHNGTSCNPVQGGSTEPYSDPGIVISSAIITDSRGQVFCCKVRGMLWDFSNVAGHITWDMEYWLDETTICYRVRHNVEERGSSISEQRTWMSLEQENPCAYSVPRLTTHQVKVNGSLINIQPGIGNHSSNYFTDNGAISLFTPDKSEGVTLYSSENTAYRTWQNGGTTGGPNDENFSYANASPKMNFDIVESTIDIGYIILGSESVVNAKLANLPPINQSFDFDFTQPNSKWYNEGGPMKRIDGLLEWYPGTPNIDNGVTSNVARIMAPARAWQASGISNIEFTMAVTGTTQLYLKWSKPGYENQYDYFQTFSVTGDGVERTYTVPVSTFANWNGIISTVGIMAVTGNPASNSKIRMRRARKV